MEKTVQNFSDKYEQCPMYYTMSILEGKWKWIILWEISRAGVIRYNRLRDILKPIAHKTLSQQLKELESHNIIHSSMSNTLRFHQKWNIRLLKRVKRSFQF